MVDGETAARQADDGSISFELCRSPRRQLSTSQQSFEPNAGAITECQSL